MTLIALAIAVFSAPQKLDTARAASVVSHTHEAPVPTPSPAPRVAAVAMPGTGSITVSLDPVTAIRGGSPAELRRLTEALDRFAEAGLALPDLEIVFFDDESDCGGHMGLFDPGRTPWRISICSDVSSVFEHELAHAWERGSLTDERRHAFMELRGYTDWSGPDVAWNERGIEGVAYVIQQGIAGLPLPPALGRETISRLEAFELLTGDTAPILVDWMGAREVGCSDRPTRLSRAVPDRTASTCSAATMEFPP